MSPKRSLRQAGFLALMVATMIQGLTPGARTLVSPWALERLGACLAFENAGAALGQLPEGDGPAAPLDADRDETPDEVVVPGDVRIEIRSDQAPIIPPDRWTGPHRRPDFLPSARPHDPPTPTKSPISSLCRMTC